MRDNNAPKTVFEIMAMFLRAYTLRIESTTPRAANTWAPYVDAFFFHVGYNLDAAVMPQRQLDEIVRQSRISRVRHRPTSAELDAPRRHYVADLVHHYQLGVSSESPMLEYISYYHVAEHWFESIYQDDLVEQIQSTITAPSFSYRRKKDVRDLIRKVSKAVQLRDDQLVINEQVALKLTLDRHVDLNNLRADLQNFDPSLLQAYENSTVSFSSGDRVPFSGEDRAEIIGALSRRIYKTRNSLVHSKDGAKGRFVPFSDDRELIREVPLLRFVAEQIIVSTSTLAPS